MLQSRGLQLRSSCDGGGAGVKSTTNTLGTLDTELGGGKKRRKKHNLPITSQGKRRGGRYHTAESLASAVSIRGLFPRPKGALYCITDLTNARININSDQNTG